ncbi:hypothetical protein PR048_030911 [Dryococelus australis]|uniref:Uncharacterized protein n=1 Tax=Dryococelus australis TaxID=614101 RepID=A0ABQ9GCT6_9NEOP|nr:hypothetical protein PR048_030911 [Dryococelus australis]
MRMIEVNMERHRYEGAGETGYPRENPPTNGERCGVVVRLLSPLPRQTGFDSRRGRSRIFACENRAGRCRWSAGFLGIIPLLPPRPRSVLTFPLERRRVSRTRAEMSARIEEKSCGRNDDIAVAAAEQAPSATTKGESPAHTRIPLQFQLRLASAWLDTCSRVRMPSVPIHVQEVPVKTCISCALTSHECVLVVALHCNSSWTSRRYLPNDGIFQQDDDPCYRPKLSRMGSSIVLESFNDCWGHLVLPI